MQLTTNECSNHPNHLGDSADMCVIFRQHCIEVVFKKDIRVSKSIHELLNC